MGKNKLMNIEIPTSTLGYLKLKLIIIKDMIINSKDYRSNSRVEKVDTYLKEKTKEYVNKNNFKI